MSWLAETYDSSLAAVYIDALNKRRVYKHSRRETGRDYKMLMRFEIAFL